METAASAMETAASTMETAASAMTTAMLGKTGFWYQAERESHCGYGEQPDKEGAGHRSVPPTCLGRARAYAPRPLGAAMASPNPILYRRRSFAPDKRREDSDLRTLYFDELLMRRNGDLQRTNRQGPAAKAPCFFSVHLHWGAQEILPLRLRFGYTQLPQQVENGRHPRIGAFTAVGGYHILKVVKRLRLGFWCGAERSLGREQDLARDFH
jgi:hypothetical protein